MVSTNKKAKERKPRKRKAPEYWPCNDCGKGTEFVSSSEVDDCPKDCMIYLCRPCDSYCKADKSTLAPTGRTANRELREWEKKAKDTFNPLWKAKYHRGCKTARDDGYAWLARQLNTSTELCHISWMSVEMLKRVVEICEPYKERLSHG